MSQSSEPWGTDGAGTDLLYLSAGGTGWGPVDALVALAARVLEAELLVVADNGEVSPAAKLSSLLPRRRGKGRRLLVVAANPALLAYAARPRHWFPGYESVAAWVIDSFWTERISRFALAGRHFDHFFVTDKDLVAYWQGVTSTPTSWLPWGTDTMAASIDVRSERAIDLLRLGRQPEAWDDDEMNQKEGTALGLRVGGRPPMGATGEANQQIVRDALADSKFVLAFHNLVSPAAYTHPTRSYVTARWTDALAAGATLVGAAPANAGDILWDGATVEISPTDRGAGLAAVRELVDGWSPEDAAYQRAQAQKLLDWRWRVAELVDVLGWGNQPLVDDELQQLKQGTGHADD